MENQYIQIMIENGVPLNIGSRDENERDVYRFLESKGISFLRADHDSIFTMSGYEEVEKQLDCLVPKNLFLCNRQETQYYLLAMPGNKVFKTKELSHQINSARLSFGKEEKLKEFLHCYPGSTSILGLLFDEDEHVKLLIDEDLLKEKYLAFHPCVNTSTVKIETKDIIGTVLPSLNHSFMKVSLVGEDAFCEKQAK